jgi:hypothetical protein
MFGERSPRRPRGDALVIVNFAYLLISGEATAFCGAASSTKPQRRWRGIVAVLRVATMRFQELIAHERH